jgi:hypothetical protein
MIGRRRGSFCHRPGPHLCRGLGAAGLASACTDASRPALCSAMLKVEVLNSITPPREFEQGAPSHSLARCALRPSGRSLC